MSLSYFMKESFWEYLLVFVCASAVSITVLNGFFLDNLLESIGWAARAALSACICAVLIFLLYVASFRRDRMVIGVVVYVLACAVLVVVSLAVSDTSMAADSQSEPAQSLYADAEGNYLYMALVLIVVCTACFLLTRTLLGSALWFVASALICSVVQAFYQSEELAMAIVATLCALTLIVYRNIKIGQSHSEISSAPSRFQNFISAVFPVACVCVLACVVWFVVVLPLNPGVLDITLRTEYRSLPISQLKGTADEHPTLNYDMTSDDLIDGFYYTTDDLKTDPFSSVEIDANALLEQQMQNRISGTDSGGDATGGGTQEAFNEDSLDEQYDPVSYTKNFPWWAAGLLLALAVALIIAGYFVGRRIYRMRRLRRMLDASTTEQAQSIYCFLLEKLSRIGLAAPSGMTLGEWASSSALDMDVLTEETSVDFRILTKTYESCTYGKYVPTEDDIVPFVAYYLRFWKAARVQLGNFRYFFKSFRL